MSEIDRYIKAQKDRDDQRRIRIKEKAHRDEILRRKREEEAIIAEQQRVEMCLLRYELLRPRVEAMRDALDIVQIEKIMNLCYVAKVNKLSPSKDYIPPITEEPDRPQTPITDPSLEKSLGPLQRLGMSKRRIEEFERRKVEYKSTWVNYEWSMERYRKDLEAYRFGGYPRNPYLYHVAGMSAETRQHLLKSDSGIVTVDGGYQWKFCRREGSDVSVPLDLEVTQSDFEGPIQSVKYGHVEIGMSTKTVEKYSHTSNTRKIGLGDNAYWVSDDLYIDVYNPWRFLSLTWSIAPKGEVVHLRLIRPVDFKSPIFRRYTGYPPQDQPRITGGDIATFPLDSMPSTSYYEKILMNLFELR